MQWKKAESSSRRPNEEGLRYHFSVDDVFAALIDVSTMGRPLFGNPFFTFLKRLHDEFGTDVNLYLFYRKLMNGRWRTLADVSDAIGDALRANHWLRLGPHALDYETPPYTQTLDEQIRALDSIYAQVDRFAPGAARSTWIRLHCFSEAHETAPYLRERGVQALLTTDKPAVSYRIAGLARDSLRAQGRLDYGGITLIRTHFRVEQFVADGLGEAAMRRAVDAVLGKQGLVVLMTHEDEIARGDVREMAFAVLDHLKARGATSI
jgi:hypothetical protein